MKTWTHIEENFLIKNYGKIYNKEIASKLNRSVRSIEKKASNLNLKSNLKNFIYSVDKNFFYKESLKTYYWAGFIAADGYIVKNRNGIEINLSIRDRSHLELFKKDCKYTGTIKDKKDSSRIRIYNVPEWKQVLKDKFNIVEKKSLILQPPHIVEFDKIMAFIKGYIDGDGSIYDLERDKGVFNIGIAGTENMLSWIRDRFESIVPPKKVDSQKVFKGVGNYYTYNVWGSRAEVLINLFKDLKTPYLKRKWNQEGI